MARATSWPPASSVAVSHCTLRPGRSVSVRTVSGASGTGRSSSMVRRATKLAGPGSAPSTARASERGGCAAVLRVR